MSLVCWSGGHDSTLVLLQLARKSSWDHPVKALAITHPQIQAKEENRKARLAILDWLKKQGHFVVYQEVQINHKRGYEWNEVRVPHAKRVVTCEPGNGLNQPQIWLSMASLYLDENEDLYMGYIRGDDIWRWREWMYGLFSNLQSLQCKKGQLICPLEWTDKYEVVDELKRAGLLDLCWTCEAPIKGIACGKCKPCRGLWTAKALHKKLTAEDRAVARDKKLKAKMELKGK